MKYDAGMHDIRQMLSYLKQNSKELAMENLLKVSKTYQFWVVIEHS